MRAKRNTGACGFTLLELMIVMAILLILVSIAAHTLDKQKAPQSLDDLISASYLKTIPKDPITGSADWTVDQSEDTISSPDQQDEGGIDDVHSASTQIGTNGTAYNTW